MTESPGELDEIDHTILRILAQDPRTPYSDIATRLEEEGYQMSSEGIRYRVSKLFETTSVQLMTAPKEHGWEVMRLLIRIEDGTPKEETFDRLTEMAFWMVCRVMGNFDFYVVATVPSNREADDLISRVREIDSVASVEHAIETDRETNTDNYLSF